MKTKQFLLLIIGICVLAWISAVVLNHLEGIPNEDGTKLPHERAHKPPFPDDKARFIHWFLQISDIHISKFWDPKRTPDLKRFCTENIDIIRPEVVLATGDLTDAKHADFMGSDQYPEEWQQYYQTLVDSKVLEKTVWLDVKGNHDAFNVPSLSSHLNYFKEYSVQGKTHLSSYKYVHKTSDGQQFSFIAVDATPNPGVRRPFNFFGMLSEDNLKLLKQYGQESRSSNMSIWFGHYPSSVLANPRPFRDILSGSTVYLSGHLHTLADFVPRMYTRARHGFLELELGDWLDNRLTVGGSVYLSGHLHTLNGQMPRMYVQHPHPAGNLELELGDWKDNRMYRLMAVDHDMFSFVDVKLGEWPLVLITNPKDAQFITPTHEPTGRMKKSTHIRILAFSPSPVTKVSVTLDDTLIGTAHSVRENLFVLPWQPSNYASGLHKIEVQVEDSEGRTKVVQQMFTLDDTQLPFDFWRRLILLMEQAFVIKTLFGLTFAGLISILLAVKIYARRATVASVASGPIIYRFVIHCWFRRLYLLCQTPAVFWPLMVYHIYVAIGPWFVGQMMDDHLGVMFVFGLYVGGAFVPAALTWAYGFIQLIMFNIPLTLYLARLIDVSVKASCQPPVKYHALAATFRHIKEHGFLYTLLILEAWFAYGGFYKAYGIWSLLIGPVRCWSLVLALILQQMALRVRSSDYKAKQMAAVSNGVSKQSADR